MIIPTKTYEKPESGLYHGVLADIVDLGLVTTTFKGVSQTNPMVRFVWLLNVNGKDGKPLQVTQRFNVSNFHEKSNLYKAMKQILNAPPDVKADIDGVLGVTRRLLIQRDKSADGAKDFANVMGILPADPGVTVPVPADYVKDRNKPAAEQVKNRAQQQQRPQTQTQAPAAAQAAPVTQAAPALDSAMLLAQIEALKSQLATGTKQGADISFAAPAGAPKF